MTSAEEISGDRMDAPRPGSLPPTPAWVSQDKGPWGKLLLRAVLPWSQLGHSWWRGRPAQLVQEREAGSLHTAQSSRSPRTRDSVQKIQRAEVGRSDHQPGAAHSLAPTTALGRVTSAQRQEVPRKPSGFPEP